MTGKQTARRKRVLCVARRLERAGWELGRTRAERRESRETIGRALDAPDPLAVLEREWGRGTCGVGAADRRRSRAEWAEAIRDQRHRHG